MEKTYQENGNKFVQIAVTTVRLTFPPPSCHTLSIPSCTRILIRWFKMADILIGEMTDLETPSRGTFLNVFDATTFHKFPVSRQQSNYQRAPR